MSTFHIDAPSTCQLQSHKSDSFFLCPLQENHLQTKYTKLNIALLYFYCILLFLFFLFFDHVNILMEER